MAKKRNAEVAKQNRATGNIICPIAESNPQGNELNKDQIIALMNVYLCEWTHRDNLLWSQVFKFFFASLFVIMLPNIAEGFGIKLPGLEEQVYRLVGGIMALIFWYVSIGYLYRLAAVGNTYQNLINLLVDENYKRESIEDKTKFKYGWVFSIRLPLLISSIMFLALILLAIFLCVN